MLIVCEGRETERNYLDSLKREDAVSRRFTITVVKGRGGSRRQIVQRAVDQKNNLNTDFDEVWLEQMLPTERFGESDVRTAVTLLANHGLAWLLKFGDLVLLRRDVLNGYAGAIIRAASAHTDGIGCVLEADIYQPDFDFTGVSPIARTTN